MRAELILITFGLWILMAQKMPAWPWFQRLHGAFPESWRRRWDAATECAFCGGYWLALILKAVTGLATLPALATISRPPALAVALDWLLDPLATAAAVHVGATVLKALGELLDMLARQRSQSIVDALRRRKTENDADGR